MNRLLRSRLLLALFCMLQAPFPLQAEEDPFAFLNDDPDKLKPSSTDPSTPSKPKETTAGSDEEALYQRWKGFEKSALEKLAQTFTPRRKVAAEILLKKAESTPAPVQKSTLEQQAQRLLDLPATTAVDVPTTDGRENSLLGHWEFNNGKWHRTFHLNGIVDFVGQETNQWHWVDQAAGVLVQHGGYSDLLWLEKPNQLRGVNDSGFAFTLTKASTQQPLFVADPVLVKLAADEYTELRALQEKLTSKRQLLSRYLHARAKKLSDPVAKKIRKHADDLLTSGFEANTNAETLSGLWEWGAQSLRFSPTGRVVTGNGVPTGTWVWGNTARKTFMVVLSGGKTAKTIFHANAPSDAKDTEMTVRMISGEKFKATRTLE